jgi:hypothetical protein
VPVPTLLNIPSVVSDRVNPAKLAEPLALTNSTKPEDPRPKMAVILVLELMVKLAAGVPPKETEFTPPKFAPVMIIGSPGKAEVGLKEVMVGGGTTPMVKTLLILKKIFPTASIFILADCVVTFGKLTLSRPSLLVLEARTVGKVSPPSVERRIFTELQLTGETFVPLTFHVTFIKPFGGEVGTLLIVKAPVALKVIVQ